MTKEALTLALEALEDNQHLIADNERHAYVMEYNSIIEKCKEALAQPEYDYKDLYEKEKRRSAMWLAKYEEVAGPAPKAHPLAQPEQGAVASVWDEGYRQGVQDERTSESNIGIAGFGAKVEPARQNPYRATPPQRKPLPYEKVVDLWLARFDTNEYDEVFMNFARAIEAAHGIKGEA